MAVEKCKGFSDITPSEMGRFRFIESVFSDRCKKWGYQEIRTPVIEHLHLFTQAGTLTPGMLGRVYSFLDWDGWSGQRVVLRPDGTIPSARYYVDHCDKEKAAKLFYISNNFVYEQTGKKNRERWQCGTELIGSGGAKADAELMVLALEIASMLDGKNTTLKLSHAGIVRAIISCLDISEDEQIGLFDQILDGNAEALSKIRDEKPSLAEIIDILLKAEGKGSAFVKNIKALTGKEAEALKAPLDEFAEILSKLDSFGISYEIDLTVGKGFEYYTGIIFRIFVDDENVGGGGRYDGLLPLLGGGEKPAAGFALYMDKLMKLVEMKHCKTCEPDTALILETEGKEREEFLVAQALRNSGYIVEQEFNGNKKEAYKWLIQLNAENERLMLTDQESDRKFEVKSLKEFLELLGGKHGCEDCSS